MTTPPTPSQETDTSAADEPTAMWDAGALKDLGLDEAAKAHEEPPSSTHSPAARSAAPTAATPKPLARPRSVPKKKTRPPSAAGPSWTTTIVLALVVAVVVFFTVRAVLG